MYLYNTGSIICNHLFSRQSYRARINRRPSTAMAVDALLIGRDALQNIGLLTAKKKVPFSHLALMPLRHCAALFAWPWCPLSQQLALFP